MSKEVPSGRCGAEALTFPAILDSGGGEPVVQTLLKYVLRVGDLNNLYKELRGSSEPGHFVERLVNRLGTRWEVSDESCRQIPQSGPVVVIANHPFGAVEGLVLVLILKRVRADVKVMANWFLSEIEELRKLMIFVDPFNRTGAVYRNIGPLRNAISWLEAGGMLVVFPAGEVSHIDLQQRRITDPKWNVNVARMIKKTGACVVPVYFRGSNGPVFQMLGLVHPLLRTILLPNEFLNSRHKRIQLEIGHVIAASRLGRCRSEQEIIDYIRFRTYLLQWRQARPTQTPAQLGLMPRVTCKPIAPALPNRNIAREVSRLPSAQILLEQGNCKVCHARAFQIPLLLHEIGRQREIAFRSVGEGTGKESDLDLYDEYYSHLFLWDTQVSALIGAYRIGHADEIIRHYGIEGLYTHAFFRFKKNIFEKTGPALELGRSFIRIENQKDCFSLPLLWKGIARYVADHPRYRTLFGAVSISNDYCLRSKQLMCRWLEAHRSFERTELSVRPRKPFRVAGDSRVAAAAWQELARDVDDMSELVAEIEPDGKGIPELLRHYLRLGGRVAGFNVDPGFSYVVDALMFVSLPDLDLRILKRMMGPIDALTYLQLHGRTEGTNPASDIPLKKQRDSEARMALA